MSLHPFAFGKLPTHGDFVARGLPPAERDAWDVWSSEAIEAARAALGDRFEERHDTTAPLRFAFGPGPFGPGWRAGAMAASIDEAGRRFIIVLGARSGSALPSPGSGEEVAQAAEDGIYRAFETGADIDRMVAEAGAAFVDLDGDGAEPVPGRFWSVEPSLDITASQPPADLLVRAMTA